MARKKTEQTPDEGLTPVVATAAGFYGQLRQPGERFYVPAGEKALWFEPVTEGEAE